jgi:hypothetical protein
MAEVNKYPGAEADDYYWGVESDFSSTGEFLVGESDGATYDYSFGIRFTNITIPKDAIIESAHITLVSAYDDANPCGADIYFNNVDDAVAPTTFGQAQALVLTSAIPWTIPVLDLYESIDTPELKTLVQQIVNRSGWASGNDMQVVVKTASGTGQRFFDNYGAGATKAELHIEYFAGMVLNFDSNPINLTLSMEGEVFAPAGLNQTFSGLTCEGLLAVRSGTLYEPLPGFLLTASGGVGTAARLLQTLPGFLVEARSGHFGNITLAGLLAEGAGITGNIGNVGARSIVPLPRFAIFANGTAAQFASLARVLPGLEISAHGYSEVLGGLDRTLPGLMVSATAFSGAYARANLPLPGFTIIASAIHENRLNTDLVLPGFFITAEGGIVPVFITCLVMNLKNLAVSEYIGWNFNSFAFFNGKYLGASSTGIHVLEGDTDNGEPIISLIKTGHIPTESARARDIYLMGRSDAQMRVTLIGDEEEESREEADYLIAKLGQDRVVTPRGLDPVYLQIALENSQGGDFDLDSIQVFGEALKRRKR